MSEQTVWEEVKTAGRGAFAALRSAIHEGNVRRVIVRNARGEPVLDLPVTVGVVGAALLSSWVAVGVLAALVTGCKLEVERAVEQKPTAG